MPLSNILHNDSFYDLKNKIFDELSKFKNKEIDKISLNLEINILTYSKDIIPCEINAVPLFDTTDHHNPKITKIIGLFRNISYQKEKEQLNQQYNRHLRSILENCNDTILTFDVKELKCSFISYAITKTLGYTPDEIIGHSFFDLTIHENAELLQNTVRSELEKSMNNNKSISLLFESQFFHKMGYLV